VAYAGSKFEYSQQEVRMKFLSGFLYSAAIGLTLCTALSRPTPSYAIEVGGVSLPDSETVEGKPLLLNGVGVRTATFLGIRVYAAGLYLNEKSKDPVDILNSPSPKKIVMKFIRNVEASKTITAWKDGIEASAPKFADTPLLNKLLSSMTDVSENDVMSVAFGASCRVSLNGKEIFSSDDHEFGRSLLSIWLGDKPPTEELKKGLLGEP
jgi:hypothetical protein